MKTATIQRKVTLSLITLLAMGSSAMAFDMKGKNDTKLPDVWICTVRS